MKPRNLVAQVGAKNTNGPAQHEVRQGQEHQNNQQTEAKPTDQQEAGNAKSETKQTKEQAKPANEPNHKEEPPAPKRTTTNRASGQYNKKRTTEIQET